MSAESFLGIWATAGAAASREFDRDGLPLWGHHPEHGYHHASESAVALAEESALHGLDLPAFDGWLSALPSGPAKSEALRHRAAALDCVRAEPLDRVRLLRHLEAMLGHWRVQTLLPLARQGRRQSVANKARAQKPRWPPEIEAHIARAKASGGSAKEQWPRLLNSLDRDGYTVREVATEKGEPAIEIDLPEGPRRLSLKAFRNRKRGPESR